MHFMFVLSRSLQNPTAVFVNQRWMWCLVCSCCNFGDVLIVKWMCGLQPLEQQFSHRISASWDVFVALACHPVSVTRVMVIYIHLSIQLWGEFCLLYWWKLWGTFTMFIFRKWVNKSRPACNKYSKVMEMYTASLPPRYSQDDKDVIVRTAG